MDNTSMSNFTFKNQDKTNKAKYELSISQIREVILFVCKKIFNPFQERESVLNLSFHY